MKTSNPCSGHMHQDTHSYTLPTCSAVINLVSWPSTAIGAKPMNHDGSDLCLPNTKKICLAPSAVVKPHLTSLHPSVVYSETLNVLQTVWILLSGRAPNVLMTLATLSCVRHEWTFNRIVCTFSDILTTYSALEPDLCQGLTASNQCHAILLRVL